MPQHGGDDDGIVGEQAILGAKPFTCMQFIMCDRQNVDIELIMKLGRNRLVFGQRFDQTGMLFQMADSVSGVNPMPRNRFKNHDAVNHILHHRRRGDNFKFVVCAVKKNATA